MAGGERLYFEEVDGQRRRVTLSGNEAPIGHFRGSPAFSTGGEVRRSLHWASGENIPDVHVTGTKERDLVLKCNLRDSLIGTQRNTTVARSAAARKDQIEAIRTAARMLRIVWAGELWGGLLRETEFATEADGEYVATLTFDIYWRGQPPKRKLRRPLRTTATVSELADLVGGAQAKIVAAPGIGLRLSETMGEFFSAVVGPVNALLSLAADLEAGATDFAGGGPALVQRAEAVFRRLQELAGFLYAMPEPDDAADAARWRKAHAEALNQVQDAIAKAYTLGQEAELRVAGVTGRVYEARDGDTLDAVAYRFSVTVTALRQANPTLPMGRLPAGTKVRIPAGS